MGFPPKAGYGLTPEPALKSRVGRAPDTPDIPANPPNPSGNAALMPDLLCYNRPPRLSKGEAHDAFRPYRYQS